MIRSLTTGFVGGATACLMGVRLSLLRDIPGWSVSSVIISGLLILLALVNWWAWDLIRISAEHDGSELLALRDRFLVTAFAASGLGIVGLNYLLGSVLPRELGFILLIASLLLVSAPAALFIRRYYRPVSPPAA